MSAAAASRALRGGRYQLGPLLAQTASSVTHQAHDTLLDEAVVITTLFPLGADYQGETLTLPPYLDAVSFDRLKADFLDEARSLRRLQRPDLLPVREAFEEAGSAHLVLDPLPGVTLGALVAEQGALDPARGLPLARQLAAALQDMHDQGLRGVLLTPEDVLLRPDGQPVVVSVGSGARQALEAHSGQVTVIPGFTPPECLDRAGAAGPPSDLYALSATLHYALTGAVPPGLPERLLESAALEGLDRLQPPALRRALEAGLALRPAERPQTAAAFLALLAADGPQEADHAAATPWSLRLLRHAAERSGSVPELDHGLSVEFALQAALGWLGDHREALIQAYGDLEGAAPGLAAQLLQEVEVLRASTQARRALHDALTPAAVAVPPPEAAAAGRPTPGPAAPVEPYREHVFDAPPEPNLLRRRTSDLAEMLAAVVGTEGPVHVSEAFRRVATAHGVGKVGSRIAEALEQGLLLAEAAGQLERRGDFLWPPGMTTPPVRTRAHLAVRVIEQVCDEELAQAARLARQQLPNSTPQDQAVQAARLLGFQRVTEGIRQRILSLMPEDA